MKSLDISYGNRTIELGKGQFHSEVDVLMTEMYTERERLQKVDWKMKFNMLPIQAKLQLNFVAYAEYDQLRA